MRRIQCHLSEIGARMFRNNVGLFTTNNGDKVRTGLCTGSADLIGWKSVTVTQDMVGQPVAVFVAIEVKRPGGKPTEEQQNFLNAVSDAGGIAAVATNAIDAMHALMKYE